MVHYPEDPEGILVVRGDSYFFKPSPVYDKIYSGFIEKIIFENGTEVNDDEFHKFFV